MQREAVITTNAVLPDLPSLDERGLLSQEAMNACAEIVASTSDRDLAAAVATDGSRLLELVLAGMRASYIGAPDVFANIVWSLSIDDAPWAQFVTHLSRGECTMYSEPPPSPTVTLRMDGVTFLRMVTGGLSPLMLFGTGKLKADGDLTFAAQLTKLFRFPDSQVTRMARWRRPKATVETAPASPWFGRRQSS